MWHAAKIEKTLFTPFPNHLFNKLQLRFSLPMPLILEMVFPGSFFFSSKLTFKMQITDYLASANFPIHTSHSDPGGLQRVHLLHTNCEQTKQCQHIISISQQLGPRLGFTEIWHPFEWAKKSLSQHMGESHICSGKVLPKQSDTIPLQNHCMVLESNEYHNTCKGKVSIYMTHTDLILLHSDLHKIRVSKAYWDSCREVLCIVSNLKMCTSLLLSIAHTHQNY
jgi:hypothetical protein